VQPNLSFEPAALQKSLWQEIVTRAPLAWYRHSYNLIEFHKSVAQDKNVIDASFFIKENATIVGLAPVLFMDTPDGLREAGLNGSPLPWPCLIEQAAKNPLSYMEFAFSQIIQMCHDYKIDQYKTALNVPLIPEKEQQEIFHSVINIFPFIDVSYLSHLVHIDGQEQTRVRASYRRNIRKFMKEYTPVVYAKESLPEDIEEAYFRLHVKDAGGQFRPRDSYKKMADLVGCHEAVFIVARQNTSQEIVGILVLATYKNSAYDSSVAIDPEYQEDYIAHILKWAALDYFAKTSINHYELGPVAGHANLFEVPSNKQKSISFFKDGFARGMTKTVYVAERHFTQKSLDLKFQNGHKKLGVFFGLNQ
jgi:hypothetical protein